MALVLKDKVTEEKPKRTATDVLLDLEQQLFQILGFCKNLDMQNKIIIENQNKLMRTLELQPKASPTLPSVGIPESLKTSQNAGKGVKAPTVSAPKPKPADISIDPGKILKEDKIKKQIGTKVSVQQAVLDQKRNKVFIANVEIFETVSKPDGDRESGPLVKQTRTNSAGKWNAQLLPGFYIVKITKMFESGETKINTGEIYIPSSDTPCILDEVIL